MLLQCYDIGGTNLRSAVYNDATQIETRHEHTRMDFLGQVRNLSKDLERYGRPDAISIVLPGPVQDGVLLKAPPLSIKQPINIKKELSNICSQVFIENDLNAAVLAEKEFGIGKQYDNFYLLSLSTGIGTGIVHNKNVISGKSGEFGHIVLERDPDLQLKCGCGNLGCWAAYSSGKGMENLAMKYLGATTPVEKIFNLAEKNSLNANNLIGKVRSYNAHGIANMINAFDANAIAVMGSLGYYQFAKVIPSRNEIRKYAVNPVPEIVKTELGDNIGLLGAYLLAYSKI